MRNRFLMSVAAAALIAGTGFANAQGTGTAREAPATGATQQSAPSSERGAPSAATPMNRNDSSQSGAPAEAPKSAQSNEKMQPQGASPKGGKSAQDNNMKGEKSKSMSSETTEKGAAGKDMKADSKGAADSKGTADNKAGSTASDSKATTTTGQAAAGGKLSTEQRTQITTVIKSQHVQPVTNVNFSISVGTKVPRNVGFHPLPAQIVTIYPDWRGYEFFLVRDQIVVVNPRTLEIVAVIDA